MLIEDVDLTRELGLDAKALIGSNGTLVHTRISGYGPEGPMADLPGAEIAAQMASEATTSLGSLTEPPVRLGTDAASTYAGIYAAQGILAALLRRAPGRRGPARRRLAVRRHADDALHAVGGAVATRTTGSASTTTAT